jgi:hypothetical protein
MNTPLGNQSVKPKPGRYFRRHLRMEQACRLEASGQFSNNEIARLLDISVITLHQMKAQPEYLAKRAELATGEIANLSSGIRQDAENLRREITDMMPAALRVIRNAITRGAVDGAPIQDLKVGLDASKELMDREGTFAKVSKSEIKVKDVPSTKDAENVEIDLLSLLQQAQRVKDTEGTNAGKTEQTITLESFVSSSGGREAQERMKEYIKLEDFNSDTVQ